MTAQADAAAPSHPHDLVLTRLIDAPADKLFRCWTDTALIPLWFVPKPWSVARAESDLRPGGGCVVVMRDPEGNEFCLVADGKGRWAATLQRALGN